MRKRAFEINPMISGLMGILLVMLGTCSVIRAEAPMVKTQVPGYFRIMVGDYEITALYDGYVDVSTQFLLNISQTEIRRLADRMFVGSDKMKSTFNAYLVNTGSKLVLIDTGAGHLYGPGFGQLFANLRGSGYHPEQVDAVMITHLHSDHYGGLVDCQGNPAFPNAVVYVSHVEHDFWLSSPPPEKYRAYFERVRSIEDGRKSQQGWRSLQDIAASYQARGRWKTLSEGPTPMPGISMILIPGHTPGQAAYTVQSGSHSVMIMGDMVNNMIIQSVHPEASVQYDVDPKQAAATRQAVFAAAAADKRLMAGMHATFPGIGRLRAEGKDTYTWVPVGFNHVP